MEETVGVAVPQAISMFTTFFCEFGLKKSSQPLR